MGTWGAGSFENDDALDWLGDFIEKPGMPVLLASLATVADWADDDYLELPEAGGVIAAAEVAAAIAHHPAADLPEEIKPWIATQTEVPPDLVPIALRAVSRVRSTSELSELWDEADGSDDWYTAIGELEMRLSAARR